MREQTLKLSAWKVVQVIETAADALNLFPPDLIFWARTAKKNRSSQAWSKLIQPQSFSRFAIENKYNYSLEIIQNFNEQRMEKNSSTRDPIFIHVKSRFVSRVCRVAQHNKAKSFGKCNWTHCCALLFTNHATENYKNWLSSQTRCCCVICLSAYRCK